MIVQSVCGDDAMCFKGVVKCMALGIPASFVVWLTMVIGTRAVLWLLPLAFMLIAQALSCELRIRNVTVFLLVLFALEIFLVRGYVVNCRHMWQDQAAGYLTQRRNNFSQRSAMMTDSSAELASLAPPNTKLGLDLSNHTLNSASAQQVAESLAMLAPQNKKLGLELANVTLGSRAGQQALLNAEAGAVLGTMLGSRNLPQGQLAERSSSTSSSQTVDADAVELGAKLQSAAPDSLALDRSRSLQEPLVDEMLTTLQPMMRADVEEEFLRDYCSADFIPRPSTPKWYPVKVFHADVEDEDRGSFNLFRATCWRWTCTYTHQKNGNAFRLILLIVLSLVMNILYLVPRKYLPVSWRDWVMTNTGCGRCQPWLVWWWLFFLTCWVIWFVTWVPHFNYVKLISTLVAAGSAAVNDAMAVIYCVVTIGALMLLYLNRRQLRSLIGIENVNVVRWSIQDIVDPDWRLDDQVFQVCVWKIQARKPGVPAPEPVMTASQLLSTVRAVITGGEAQAQMIAGSHLGSQPVKYLEKQGVKNDLYVRFECGDNELRQTCVQNGILLMPHTEVLVKETLRFNLEPSRSEELLVAVCNQDVVGSTERGRVALDMDALNNEIYRVEGRYLQSRRQSEEEEHLLEGQELQNQLHAKQVTAMFKVDRDPRMKAADEQAMRALGFRPFELNRGGCIWMAFAPLTNEDA